MSLVSVTSDASTTARNFKIKNAVSESLKAMVMDIKTKYATI